MKALLVEDKKQLADALREYLKMHKVDAVVRLDGKEGYQEAKTGNYDVIVLDLMLPYMDGLSIIRQLREDKIDTPILVLTAKVTTDDKVECLLAGADDYLTKPFVLEELLARLVVLTRRKSQFVPNVLTFGNITLDKLNHTISDGNVSISLSMKEYQIMELLMDNADKIGEKTKILDRVWGERNDTYYNSAEVYISFLRRKLDALHATFVIKSVRNVGYKLKMLELDEEEH